MCRPLQSFERQTTVRHDYVTMLHDPFDRLVSGWFYHGHHPGSDVFNAWPCLRPSDCNCVDPHLSPLTSHPSPLIWPSIDHQQAFLSQNSRQWNWWERGLNSTCSASFEEYALSSSYSNIATRMLGDDGFAYDSTNVTDSSLTRAKATLTRLPFVGIQELAPASILLFASTFAGSPTDRCLTLWHRLRSLFSAQTRPSASPQTRAVLASMRPLAERQNTLDMQLYKYARGIFCNRWRRAIGEHPCVQLVLAATPTNDTLWHAHAACAIPRDPSG